MDAKLGNTPVRQTEVSIAISTLHNQIGSLQSIISKLFERLCYVSNQKPPTEYKTSTERSNCGLAQEINNETEKIQEIIESVSRQIEDLEI